VEKGHSCWHCPVACKAVLKAGEGEYKYTAGCHRPEYETAAAFGSNCLNNHTESIQWLMTSATGEDWIQFPAVSVIAFAMELYEMASLLWRIPAALTLNG